MKFSKAFKYQLNDVKTSLISFYGVMIGVEILLSLLIAFCVGNVKGNVIGLDAATPVFLFILSLCIFSTNFSFLNQNSISRRTMVLSCFAMFATVAGIMLAIDAINAAIMYMGDFYKYPYSTVYEMIFHQFESADHRIVDKTSDILQNLPTVSQKLTRISANLIFNYVSYIAAAVSGYFISVVFYRLSKIWRIIVFIIIPVVLLNSAYSIYRLGESFFDTISRWMDRNIFNSPTGTIILMLIWIVVFGTLSYIIATRAGLKPKKE